MLAAWKSWYTQMHEQAQPRHRLFHDQTTAAAKRVTAQAQRISMDKTNQLTLPDGTSIEYGIRVSTRARTIRLTLNAADGLTVVTPPRIGHQRIAALVTEHAGWIARRMKHFDALRTQIAAELATRPVMFELPALAESWRVDYQATSSPAVRARTRQTGQIIMAGAVDDTAACHAALRDWLARRARATLPEWLSRLAAEANLQYTGVTVRNQRTRWGSCSAAGRISLNSTLLFLRQELVQYVLWHELCHLIELNHSRRFWEQVQRLEPNVQALRQQMRSAWEIVPAWAHPPSR